jgi:4-amino-4-deoxychorismate lyase
VDTLWLVNGRPTAAVDPSDRGLAYGDGLFETMAAADGRIRWLDYHLDRLADGCRRLALGPLDHAEIRAEIATHCPRAGRAVLKLIVTRGSGARGYRPPEPSQPTRILGVSSWPDHSRSHYTGGIRVRVCELRIGESPALAGLKHLCRLEQVLAQIELRGHDVEQGLLLDTSGYVVGGTSSNVFAIRGTDLLTPSTARNGIAGVMRRAVLESAANVGLRPIESNITLRELQRADELFMTNAVFGIWPVAKLDDQSFAPGAATRRLMEHLDLPRDA